MHTTTDLDRTNLDIQYDANQQEVWLSVAAAAQESIHVCILDHLGRNVLEQQLHLEKDSHLFKLPSPQLRSGQYNCWVTIGSNMHLRAFNVKTVQRSLWWWNRKSKKK